MLCWWAAVHGESDKTEQLHFHFSLSCIGEGNGNPLQCSCLENPRDGEPGGLPPMGSHRVGHDWSDFAAAAVLCLVAQSCLILCNPMDCSPSGSSVHGDSPGKNTGVGCHALLQEIVPTEGSNPGLPHCRQVLYCLSHQGSQRILECVAYAFSRGSSWPRNQTWDYCIAGRFFTSWAGKATRELPGRSIKIDIGFNKNILSVHKATIIIMNLRGDTDMVTNKTQWTLLKTLEYMYKTVFSSVHSFSCVQLFATPWTAPRQASLSITNSWSLLKLMSIESVMPSNHLILCHPLLLLPSIFPSIRIFSNETVFLDQVAKVLKSASALALPMNIQD